MSEFQEHVLDKVKEAQEGNIVSLPVALSRVTDVLSVRKGIYTLLGGNTGSGKTAFVDDVYVLKPYETLRRLQGETDITFKVLYRSMERRKSQKLAKWACWKLYVDHKILVDTETLMGHGTRGKLPQDVWEKLVGCRDWADEMLDFVDIRDGRTTPDQYNAWVTAHALRTGTLYIANLEGVYKAGETQYIDKFSVDKFVTLRNGDTELIVRFTHKNVDYVLRQGEKRYFPNKEKEITITVADHIGKFDGDGSKLVLDIASKHCADHRDIFNYSPVVVSQFNREVGNTQRIKFSDGDLSPILEDFKGTANSQEDSDVTLSIFNPFRYGAYSDQGMYKGYNIRDRMTNALGHNRFRLLSILKNSYGIDDVTFGMKFMGEVNYFSTLPKPNPDGSPTPELLAEYDRIAQGY